jgi:hypothetical protein
MRLNHTWYVGDSDFHDKLAPTDGIKLRYFLKKTTSDDAFFSYLSQSTDAKLICKVPL